jgi:hypothetical protein
MLARKENCVKKAGKENCVKKSRKRKRATKNIYNFYCKIYIYNL